MKIGRNTCVIMRILLCVLLSIEVDAQQENSHGEWSDDERAFYENLRDLCIYLRENRGKLSKDTLFKKYIHFDYVLNDGDKDRRDLRIKKFDTIFYTFRHYIDSLGLENLDAKPIRFFKHTAIYKPFEKEELQQVRQDVFAYFIKSTPETPRGSLLFDRGTKKLAAWILLNQGGYYYYLTFRLL